MMNTLLRRTGLFVLVATLLMGSTVLAQENRAPNDDISPDEIERVAEVLLKIDRVRTTYQKKIQKADEKKQVRAYQQKLKTEIDQTIANAEALTPKRYEAIMQAAQNDDSLKQEILSMVKKKRKTQASR